MTGLALVASFVAGSLRNSAPSHAAGLSSKNYDAFMGYMQSKHKAPFDHDAVQLPAGALTAQRAPPPPPPAQART